jgi:hypothetical protein
MRSHTEYTQPEAILADPRLTAADRRKMLIDWECDLRQRLRAGNENMLGRPGVASKEAALYQRVHNCLTKVNAQEERQAGAADG